MILTLSFLLWDFRHTVTQAVLHLFSPLVQLILPASIPIRALLGHKADTPLTLSGETYRALQSLSPSSLTTAFILDSGCTRHMFHRQELFESIEPLDDGETDKVTGIGEYSLKLCGKGTVVLPILTAKGDVGWLRIHSVVYCPDLGTNLLSCLDFIRKGMKVEFDSTGATLSFKTGKPVTFTASISHDLFCLDVNIPLLKGRIDRPGHVKKTYDLYQQRRAYMAHFEEAFDALKPIQQRSWYRALAAFATKEVYAIWHERMGHLGEENLVKLKDMAEGLDLKAPPALCTCEACLEGRMTKAPHKGHISPGRYPDELIHMDTVGPLFLGEDGSEYFIHFHCDKTKEAECYTMKTKSEALAKFKLFQGSRKGRIMRLRTDNGGEYISKAFQLHLAETGVHFEPSVPHNPQMNGAAERIGRTLWTIVETLLKSSGFDSKWWPQLLHTAVYLYMRRPHNSIGMTPYEAKNLCKPFVNHLKIIGSRAWFIDGKQSKKKPREEQVVKGRLIGYEGDHIYRILTDDERIRKAHGVHIVEKRPSSVEEETFEYGSTTHPDSFSHSPIEPTACEKKRAAPTVANIPDKRTRSSVKDRFSVKEEETFEYGSTTYPESFSHSPIESTAREKKRVAPTAANIPDKRIRFVEVSDDDELSANSRPIMHEIRPKPAAIPAPAKLPPQPPRTRPAVVIPVISPHSTISGLYNTPTHSTVSSTSHSTPVDEVTPGHPVLEYPDPDSPDPLSLVAFLAKQDTAPHIRNDSNLNRLLGLMARVSLAEANSPEPFEPQHYREAMADADSDRWIGAMKEEFTSLQDNKTWTLVDRPSNQRVLPGKWVYKHKRGPKGDIMRYKARWVIRGDQQREGVDFNETFATVVKPMSYKLIFAIAAALDWEIDQMDVKTAFLYGKVEETVYMEQPTGLEDGSTKVCKLDRAIYGLKQAPRVWYNTLSEFLQQLDFSPLDADASVFHKKGVIMAIYVDDLLITGRDRTEIGALKAGLNNRFQMSDLGPVHFYLGMTVTRDRPNRTLRLGQYSYLTKVLRDFGMGECKAAATPMDVNGSKLVSASKDHIATPSNVKEYQRLIGSLMYAMLGSRPDIAFAVSMVSRFASNPTVEHMVAAKRILRYLRGTLDYQLTYRGDLGSLTGYSDADWAGDHETRRSTGGFVFHVGSGVVSWSSKRQATVALSSCESELMAETQAAKEAVWLKKFLAEALHQEEVAVVIHCDNQGAIALAKNDQFHARTKHIDIREKWIREAVAAKQVELQYISTDLQLADGLTKPLARDKFEYFRRQIGVERVP
jgi:transposase InsO family protein